MEVIFEKFLGPLIQSKPEGKILVAVSGGIDSMVLATLLNRFSKPIVLAHCNFGLRGEESDGDERFIRQFAQKLHVQLFVKHFETSVYASENKISIQMAARELRYVWFVQLATEQDCEFIAVAHHFDDQIETFFIHLFRGSGIKGLRGISAKNGNVIRPLLFAQRTEIEQYALKNDIPYREDSSNVKNTYLRNNIRNQLLPIIYELIDGSKSGIMQSLDYLSQNELLYEELVAKAKQDLMQMDGEIVRIDKAELLKMEALEAFLFECISPYGFKGPLLQSIIIALKSNPGAVFYSTAYRLTINRDILEIEPVKQYGNRSQFTINKEDTVMYTPIGLTLSSIIIGPEFEIVKSRDIIYLDLDLLKFPLIVRKWKDGDRFVPFGMKGSKLVSDFFIDLHFTRHQKEDCWLLCDADDSILWVIGHRSDDIYKINENTQQVLKIQLVQ